jgi:threonine dehydratase
MISLPTYDDVAAASERLAGHAHRTPVLRSSTADAPALQGAKVGVIVSGGNVDLARYAALLGGD